MIPIAKPLIGDEEIEAVIKTMRDGTLAQGEGVKRFEEAFAEYIGTKYAVAVNSGTAALHVALLSHEIAEGDEVITTSFTFISTANSMLFVGAKPVFSDVREEDFNIDPDGIMEKITPKTIAIIPVHLYGHPAEMKAIGEMAEDHNIIVIEDACQAHGARIDDRMVGSFGTGCFSFYPTKNMTTGEGGMITTDDEAVCEKARMIRSHGSKVRYKHEMLGYNVRMTDIGAVMGFEQLKKLSSFTKRRQENAKYLSGKLKLKGIITPRVLDGCEHVFHQYTIRVTEESDITRDDLVRVLNEEGIDTGIHYPIPIHKQPFYLDMGYNDHLPVSEKLASQVVSLPIHPSISNKDLDYISDVIREALGT
ncbi:MAG: DegT/DnrJ/EryC1/StrS aminotransferase family protein [Halobacteriota archaeon]|nr:DegT/DnrJ/EryC1/StrS aminotransferase family protein [Halobacteriota archaeon]